MPSRDELLRNILSPKTKRQATYLVHAQAKHYNGFRKVYIPHTPFEKLQPGMEARVKISHSRKVHGKLTEEDIERSIRRTKMTVRDYVWCNQFELFVTFTFNCKPCRPHCDNKPCTCGDTCLRFNADHCKKRMANWLNLQQKRKGKFQYLIVPEFHKDDKSIHFHALIKNYPGKVVKAINPKTGRQLIKRGREVFSFPSYTLGLEEVYIIDDTTESHAKVGNYCRKYITKDMVAAFGRHRYWCSNDLVVPLVEDNPDDWYITETPDNGYVSDYGIFLEFLDKTPEPGAA